MDIEILSEFIELRKRYYQKTNEEILKELNYDFYLQLSLSLNEKKQQSSETIAKEIEILKLDIDSSQHKLNEIYSLLLSINGRFHKQNKDIEEIKESMQKIANKKGFIFN